ncbi:MAG: transposase [Phycisphaerae bacterium]|nr:transposase [Phycisphaerae bacterium]
MPRIARVVVPSYPHHVTQRGNRRQQTFFCDDDYRAYLGLMAEWCRRCGVEIWAYCLMPNHVHLIAVPNSEDGLRRGVGEAHRRYTRRVNFRERWRGHLWQGRFASFVLDDYYLLAATRYVEMNPVRAGMVDRPESYPWSSASAHLAGQDDVLVKVASMLDIVDDWRSFLSDPAAEGVGKTFQHHERTGRPLGEENFLTKLEGLLNRVLKPKKPGRKSKKQEK